MGKYKSTLNLLGCCVIRDIFGLHEDDGGYSIKRFVQNVSPVSAVTNSPLLREIRDEDLLLAKTKRFFAKCQKLELEKGIFEYIKADRADYLVVDVAEFRRKLYFFGTNKGYFSENYNLRYLFDNYIEAGIIPGEYKILSPFDIDQAELDMMLEMFCRELEKICSRDRIIFVEIKAGGHHDIDNVELCDAEDRTAEIFNKRITYAYEKVRAYLSDIHVIEFPCNVSIEPRHKWGRNLLHFVGEYYDYALNAINVITEGNLSLQDERLKLKMLKEEYEQILSNKYGQILSNRCGQVK